MNGSEFEVGELVEILNARNDWVPGMITAILNDGIFAVETKTEEERIHVSAAAAAVRALCQARAEKRESFENAEAESERLAQRAFGSLRVEEAFEWLSQYSDQRGRLSREKFNAALGCAIDDPYEHAGAAILFRAFDTDGDGNIDSTELAAGLSLWCRGSQSDRIRAAFCLFDADGDGTIDLGEMKRYLASVFKVALASKPELRAVAQGASAQELAEETALMIFTSADKNHDGVLSLQEFAEWYTNQSGALFSPEDVDSLVSEEDAVRILSSALRGRDPREVWLKFMAETQNDQKLSRQSFYRAIDSLYTHNVPNDLDVVASRAFELFDADHNGYVDARELAAGLAALCGGSRDAKVRFCFQLFDTDTDGFLDREELAMCLSSVFRVTSYRGGLPQPPDELAIATADAMLDACDKTLEGRISYDDFDNWLGNCYTNTEEQLVSDEYQSETVPRETTQIYIPPNTEPVEKSPLRKVNKTARTVANTKSLPTNGLASAAKELELARTLLGLGSGRISVDDVVDVALEAADAAGRIDANAFAKALRRLARLSQVADRQAAATLSQRLFDALSKIDPTPKKSVAAHDLAAGLAVLCPDPVTDRIEAIFALFAPASHAALDANGLQSLLTAIFTFLAAISQSVQSSLTAKPDHLAVSTTEKCFHDLGLDPTAPSLYPRDFALFISKDSSLAARLNF